MYRTLSLANKIRILVALGLCTMALVLPAAQAKAPPSQEQRWTGSTYRFFHHSKIDIRSVVLVLVPETNRVVLFDLTTGKIHDGTYRYDIHAGKDAVQLIFMDFPGARERWWGAFTDAKTIKGYVDDSSGSQYSFIATR